MRARANDCVHTMHLGQCAVYATTVQETKLFTKMQVIEMKESVAEPFASNELLSLSRRALKIAPFVPRVRSITIDAVFRRSQYSFDIFRPGVDRSLK